MTLIDRWALFSVVCKLHFSLFDVKLMISGESLVKQKNRARYISAPTDYKILWADIGSFGGYPAGVVITDRAMIAKASREETKNIVREGKLTYNQALNLAKAGTIESITFDAYTGAVNCLSVFVCLLLPLLHRLIG